MAKNKKQQNQPAPKGRSNEARKRTLERKLKNVTRSSGKRAAMDFLKKLAGTSGKTSVGRGRKPVEVIIPVSRWKQLIQDLDSKRPPAATTCN